MVAQAHEEENKNRASPTTRRHAPDSLSPRDRATPPREQIFVLAFLAVLSLTVLSLGVSILLSFQGQLNPQQVSLFETCSTTWKLGFGGMLGLIGGKLSESNDHKARE